MSTSNAKRINLAFEPVKFVDQEGYLTEQWEQILNQLFIYIQENLSGLGLVPPSFTAAEIADLEASGTVKNGTIIYDSTNDVLKTYVGGSFKTITTS